MTYELKKAEEIGWAALIGAGIFGLEMLVRFDASTITDWKAWAVALGGGMLRAAAGAVLAKTTGPRG